LLNHEKLPIYQSYRQEKQEHFLKRLEFRPFAFRHFANAPAHYNRLSPEALN
jgi:hypothetical protein